MADKPKTHNEKVLSRDNHWQREELITPEAEKLISIQSHRKAIRDCETYIPAPPDKELIPDEEFATKRLKRLQALRKALKELLNSVQMERATEDELKEIWHDARGEKVSFAALFEAFEGHALPEVQTGDIFSFGGVNAWLASADAFAVNLPDGTYGIYSEYKQKWGGVDVQLWGCLTEQELSSETLPEWRMSSQSSDADLEWHGRPLLNLSESNKTFLMQFLKEAILKREKRDAEENGYCLDEEYPLCDFHFLS